MGFHLWCSSLCLFYFFTCVALVKAGPVMGPFVDNLCYLCLVFVMLSRLSIAALWSPAVKGLTSCL